jgi:hypothetical protein
VGGEIAPDVLGTLKETFGPADAATILAKAQELAQEKAVGSIGNQEELPAPAPDAAQIAADQPAQKPQSEAEVNAQAPVEPTPSFLPKAPLSTPAGGTVDLSGRNTGEPFSDITAKPTMFDSVVRNLQAKSEAAKPVVQDITPAATPEISQKAYDETVANGGVTIDAKGNTGNIKDYSPRATSEVSVAKEQFHPGVITQYISSHAADLNTGDGNLGIWQENGNYHIAVADKTAYNGGNGETTNGANIDQGKNTGAGNSGGDGSGSQVSEGAIGVNSESKQNSGSGNDNGAKAGSTGEKQAGSKANGNAEGPVNADGSPAKTAEPSATDSGIAKNTQILEDAFKGDPQFKGTTFKTQVEAYNQLLSEDRSKLFDIATEKIAPPDGVVPSAMAELLRNDPNLTGEEALRLNAEGQPYASSKAGQGLSLSRLGDPNDPVTKIREVNDANDSKAKTDDAKVKAKAEQIKKAVRVSNPKTNWNDFVASITC